MFEHVIRLDEADLMGEALHCTFFILVNIFEEIVCGLRNFYPVAGIFADPTKR